MANRNSNTNNKTTRSSYTRSSFWNGSVPSVGNSLVGNSLFRSAFNTKPRPEPYDEELEIALALSVTEDSESKVDPIFVFSDFMDLFYDKDFPKALELYSSSNDELKELIDYELDQIPWRISCEYLFNDGKVCWFNTWIKIGWWPEDEFELSPQLGEGNWFSESGSLRSGINSNCFQCTVWKGKGKEMIHKLLSVGPKTNLELEFVNGSLVPINIAFKRRLSPDNIFDLTRVETGSFIPLPEEKLDTFRIFDHSVENSDGTSMFHYKGCSLGHFLIIEDFRIMSEDIEEFCPETSTELDWLEDVD